MEMINHPSHYNLEGKKECIEQMREDYGETIAAIFSLTNAYKYLYRAGHKNDKKQDIDKARWYLNYFNDIEDTVLFDSNLSALASDVEEWLSRED